MTARAAPRAVPEIFLQNVTKSYPLRSKPALDDVTIEIFPGEFVSLMGPSGSGKSTLLNLIGALDTATQGTVAVGERVLNDMKDQELTAFRRENVAFIFQTFHLIPSLTALENVLTPILAVRKSRGSTARAFASLDAVGLGGKEKQLPGELSGGEQQRVAIARALITKPRVLLADEPTGNLDAATGSEVMELIGQLHQTTSVTVVLATHDPQVALRSERVLALRDGKVATDTPVRPGQTPADLMEELARSDP